MAQEIIILFTSIGLVSFAFGLIRLAMIFRNKNKSNKNCACNNCQCGDKK